MPPPVLHVSDDEEENENPQPKGIDKNLPPIVLHGLDKWNTKFDYLEGDDDNNDNNRTRDIFALTGHYSRGRNRYRAGLDFDRYKVEDIPDADVFASCDIDSVLGIVKGVFPIAPRATFLYYMLPDVRYTLSSNLDLPPIEVPDQADKIPLHKIPNCRFGQMGRLLVRFVFPLLYDPEQQRIKDTPNYVGAGPLQMLFDQAVRPATDAIIPVELRRQWPTTYANEYGFRAAPNRHQPEEERVHGGITHQHTGREIHGQHFNDWLQEIKRLVDEAPELTWARGFVLLVEGKGLKLTNLSTHDLPDQPLADEVGNLFDPRNARTEAIKAVLEELVPANFIAGEWFIDIATSLGVSLGVVDPVPACLLIDSDLHPEIINHFSGVPLGQCNTWVRRKAGGYERDILGHVERLAGFRISFDKPQAYGIRKFQAYTSNKSVSYRPDGRRKAKRTTPSLILKDWPTERKDHFHPLSDVFFDASVSHPVAVRLESRVPFESYPYVHLELDWPTFSPWLFCVRNTQFWGFLWRRLLALWNVLDRVFTPLEARSRFSLQELPEVGSLLVLLAYMSNALVNRPDDGSHFDEVHDAGCVHQLVNRVTVPVVPLGYYCLHSLHLPATLKDLPRMSSLRTISRETIVYLSATTAEGRTEHAFARLMKGKSKAPNTKKTKGDPWGVTESVVDLNSQPHRPNKHHRVSVALVEDVLDVFSALLPPEQLRTCYPSEDLDDEARDTGVPISKQVSTLVHTYPLQIFAKAPNKKLEKASRCTLDSLELENINFSIFSDPSAPSRLFTSHNDFGRHSERWNTTIRALLPTVKEKEKLGRPQGLSQLDVWRDWETLLLYMSPEDQDKTVKAARSYVTTHWSWLPFYSRSKLWVTGPAPSINSARVVGSEPGGPWIVFNPRFPGTARR